MYQGMDVTCVQRGLCRGTERSGPVRVVHALVMLQCFPPAPTFHASRMRIRQTWVNLLHAQTPFTVAAVPGDTALAAPGTKP